MIEREAQDEPMAVDVSGFDAVYGRERGGMLRLSFLIVGSTEAAEDVVHDAFVELFHRWDRIDAPGAYLRRAVVNRSVSLLRHRQVEDRHLAQHRDDLTAVAPDGSLWDAVSRLSARQRTALVLTFYLDLPSDEAASLMGCRAVTVRSLVHRGLTALRKELS